MGQKYNPRAKADKQLQVLAVPNQVIADATTAQRVGKGALCRIQGVTDGYVKFGDNAVEVPSASTKETIKTPNDFFVVAATDEYIRTSAVMRVEVIKD